MHKLLGEQINFFHLYRAVQADCGSRICNEKGNWGKVARTIGVNDKSSSAHRLKEKFMVYLQELEIEIDRRKAEKNPFLNP